MGDDVELVRLRYSGEVVAVSRRKYSGASSEVWSWTCKGTSSFNPEVKNSRSKRKREKTRLKTKHTIKENERLDMRRP